MKSFKQYNEAVQVSTEDETHASFNIQDPVALQKLNGFVGALAEQEYLQPDAAIHQMAMKLGTVGLQFALPRIEGNGGKTVVELTQFGGRYGKTPDNSNGPMSKGDEIEDGDGISHRKEGGLKLEFKWEKQENNTYKVFANLI